MTRPSMEVDEFAMTLEKMVKRLGDGINGGLPDVVQAGVRRAAKNWRRNAKDSGWSKGDHTYRKHGKTYTTGKYVESIRSHMISRDPKRPYGEVGVPRMPGLAHLLEDGHVRIGGGRVRAFPHVKPAADEAFSTVGDMLDSMIDEVFDDV